jgi:hypothetical protein
MDFPTAYGTRLLSPFSWRWYSVDLMPIVDVYLLIVLAGGLIVGRHRPALRRDVAMVAMAYTLLNYTVRGVAHQWAVTAAPQVMAPVLPEQCPDAVRPSVISHWPIDNAANHRERASAPCLVEIAAMPTFFSPFRWQVIARTTDSYQLLDLHLLRDRVHPPDTVDAPWRDAVRHPDQWTPAVLRAAETDVGRTFLGFSRFPATQSELHADRSATVRWTDLRFVNTPGRRTGRAPGMFSVVVRLASDGRVLATQPGE